MVYCDFVVGLGWVVIGVVGFVFVEIGGFVGRCRVSRGGSFFKGMFFVVNVVFSLRFRVCVFFARF